MNFPLFSLFLSKIFYFFFNKNAFLIFDDIFFVGQYNYDVFLNIHYIFEGTTLKGENLSCIIVSSELFFSQSNFGFCAEQPKFFIKYKKNDTKEHCKRHIKKEPYLLTFSSNDAIPLAFSMSEFR